MNAHEAVRALAVIGARTTPDLVCSAIDITFSGTVPRDISERRDQLARISASALAQMGTFDECFFEYADDLTALMYTYAGASDVLLPSTGCGEFPSNAPNRNI